mmetsp:Transcript_26419/g.48580  ORF Transcript_26419/g.48580 Transcript_26419/m.48580 type:complete len:107 (+) Transcript_26419:37-357(+)
MGGIVSHDAAQGSDAEASAQSKKPVIEAQVDIEAGTHCQSVAAKNRHGHIEAGTQTNLHMQDIDNESESELGDEEYNEQEEEEDERESVRSLSGSFMGASYAAHYA